MLYIRPSYLSIFCISFVTFVVAMASSISNRVVAQAEEILSLDFVMQSYDQGQIRPIVTSGLGFVEVSADGKFIYALGDGIYRVSDGERVLTVSSDVASIEFSPDGKHFLQVNVGVGRLDDMVIVYPTVNSVQFSSDGSYIAVDTEGVYRLSDSSRVEHIAVSTSYRFLGDSPFVAVVRGEIYHLTAPENTFIVPDKPEGVWPHISPNGQYAWARNANLIHIASGQILSPTGNNYVQFTPNERWAIVRGYGIFDLSTNSNTPSIEFTSPTALLAISPLGKYFATLSGVFSIEDGQKLIDTEHIDQPEFRFAPDDTSVVILPTLELYILEPLRSIHESLVGFQGYHANGRYISTSTQLLQANDLSVVFSWQERQGNKIFDKSGRFMAIADDAVYNLETGEKLFAIAGNPWRFSVDSDYLDIGYLTSPHAIYRTSDSKRYEGLEPLYTEFGLLQVGQVVLVVQEDTLQTPINIIQFKPDMQTFANLRGDIPVSNRYQDYDYLAVLAIVDDWVQVGHGATTLWIQVDYEDVLSLP
jgi:WD40 repeat protein